MPNNPPVTAAGLASVVSLLLAAFTGLSPEQVAALTASVALVAAFAASRFTTPLTRPDRLDQADHANPDDFHAGTD